MNDLIGNSSRNFPRKVIFCGRYCPRGGRWCVSLLAGRSKYLDQGQMLWNSASAHE